VLALALVLLGATLGVAVARPRRLGEAPAACAAALALIAVGAIGLHSAGDAVRALAPTVGFLAALLVLAEGCRLAGLFDALGGLMAARSGGEPRRLLALVFAAASATTIVLGLDATVVLLTPVVIVTASRLRTSPRAHAYACTHLANSASLLLPISNLTNLLAFRSSGVSFARFAALMALPTVAAVAVDWLALAPWAKRGDPRPARPIAARERLPRYPLVVLALTLAGFTLSSVAGVAPEWIAAAGAAAMTLPALIRRELSPAGLARALHPGFLVFVLALGVIVAAAGADGLSGAVRSILPGGASLGDLLAISAISAALANLVNNLPATLILVPVAAQLGPGPVLAVLIGVDIGPNLTEVGSLATLLWRRVLHAEGVELGRAEFARLGLLTVPPGLVLATVLLWLGLQLI
jgi:arsenical pump membrane protein